MDIFIKSFNRPYYLDRCIQSIYKYVAGDFTIQILEDGTPAPYLEKIVRQYPNVKIHRSPAYKEKAEAIQQHISGGAKYAASTIPTAFWIRTIAAGSPIFLLLEDDIWLTAPLVLEEVETVMQQSRIHMLRLAWQGNAQLIKGTYKELAPQIEEVIPSLSSVAARVVLNKFKLGSVLYKLGLLNPAKEFRLQVPFYTLYTVASAFFDKAYWLHLWQDGPESVNETYQLRNAITWYYRHRGRYAKTVTEAAKTSFITSATNNFEGIDLDVFQLNHALNEAWLTDALDPMQGFPADLPEWYLKNFLGTQNKYDEWIKWVEKFKAQYRKVGCVVD